MLTTATRTLRLAENLELPLEAVVEKFAFMGQSGGGKSYAAMKFAEEMLLAGVQIVALDGVGIWWGLRVGADGKGPGLSIPVFGNNKYADLPLPVDSGAVVADLIVAHRISAVLDVSEFTMSETKRFVTAFTERFFHAKKQSRSRVHVFLEEAQMFAPQMPEADERVMLNRIESMARIGRNYGIGWSVISQRPQELHKKVVNQAGTLLAFRTIGKHERAALSNWVDDKAQSKDEAGLLDGLPFLETGVARVWSPYFLKIAQEVRISPRRTYVVPTTSTDEDDEVQPEQLAPVDLEQLRELFAATVEQAKSDDPKLLHKEIDRLRRELAARPKEVVVQPETVIEYVKVPTIPRDIVQDFSSRLDVVEGGANELRRILERMQGLEAAQESTSPRPASVAPKAPKPPAQPEPKLARALGTLMARNTEGGSTLKAGQRWMLEIMAAAHPRKLTRPELGILSGFSPKGGTFGNYVGGLKGAGLVDEAAGQLELTGAGWAAVGQNIAPLPTTQELVELWGGKVKAGQRVMLDLLVAEYPNGLSRAELGARSGFESTGGTFGNYVGQMKGLGLVNEESRILRAVPALFISGGE